MRQVDEQNQSEQQEQDRPHQRNVIPPYFKEPIGNQERRHNQPQPDDDLGPPESVLDGSALVSRVVDADQQHGHGQMEDSEGEVDAMHRREAETRVSRAADRDVVEEHALELLDRPVGEHEPGQEAVDEEDQSISDSGRDGVVAFPAGAADGLIEDVLAGCRVDSEGLFLTDRACCRSAT